MQSSKGTELVRWIAVRLLTAIGATIGRPEIRWLAAPPPHPCVYFANHSSHLDFILIRSALPEAVRSRTRPVAAADYWGSGGLRAFFARAFDPVLVERVVDGRSSERPRAGDALERMLDALDKDNSLVLFPEGTRMSTNGASPFRAGLYYLCRQRPGLRLVPVRIENSGRALPKGSFVPVPTRVRVTFGASIALEKGEEKSAFLERARQAVVDLGEEATATPPPAP